jgi:hypothetical protein
VTVTVRPARPDELDKLLALYRELYPEDPEVALTEAVQLWKEICGDRCLFIRQPRKRDGSKPPVILTRAQSLSHV